jgi:hypothetical protein
MATSFYESYNMKKIILWEDTRTGECETTTVCMKI